MSELQTTQDLVKEILKTSPKAENTGSTPGAGRN